MVNFDHWAGREGGGSWMGTDGRTSVKSDREKRHIKYVGGLQQYNIFILPVNSEGG